MFADVWTGAADKFDSKARLDLWPWWQALRLLSRTAQMSCLPPHLEYMAGWVGDSLREWAESVQDGEDDSGETDWNPLNEVTLHELKFAVRCGEPKFSDQGVPQARQIDHLMSALPWPFVPPWSRDFRADRSTWLADIRAEVEERMAAAGCLPPELVPPFQRSDVPHYRYEGPPGSPPCSVPHRPLFLVRSPTQRPAPTTGWPFADFDGKD